MKKSFLAVAVLLGAAVCVSSCTDEDFEEQLYDGTAAAGTVGAAQPVSHDLRTHVVATKGAVGAAQPVSHDLRTHVVATKGTVGAAQPVSHDLRTHVVAARSRQELDHIGAFNFVRSRADRDHIGAFNFQRTNVVAAKAKKAAPAGGKDAADGKAEDVAK